jgi:hypothetical protein
MCQKANISDADSALANLIWKGIENEPVAKNIISNQEQISFSSPKNTDRTRKLSIFLYSITIEPTFALHYLVIPYAGNDTDNHSLLETIVRTASAAPSITNSNGKNDVEFTVKIDSLSLDALSKLWVALGAPLRLSVCLTLSYAELPHGSQAKIESAITTMPQTPALDTKNTFQLYQVVLKTFTEQSQGWRNRNMLFKQWVFQNFEKNAGMTADEMFTMLNNLGDKLEQHGSTTQFIKPLNQLLGYYEHQLGELKGMQKVSHGQRENIETINTWIDDVKVLVEALGS